ncbi:MAG: hypothetical protein HYT10_02190 [Candidatus Levybacteria bacterium]|nr:hypothetical protein [Candidatus Levybacteria bacterium]
MDPKTAQNLDPKLKEAYDRVMGTSLPATSPAPAVPPSQPAPHIETTAPTPPPSQPMQIFQANEAKSPPPQHTSEPAPFTHVNPPAVHTASPVSSTSQGSTISSGFVAGGTKNHSSTSSESAGVSSKVLFLAGVVFFLIYTLFWIKFTGLTLPFLPQ